MRTSALLLAAWFGAACGGGPSQSGSNDPGPPAVSATPDLTASARSDAAPAGKVDGASSSGSDEGPRYLQAGAPGEASRELTAEELAALDVPDHSEADVRFMQGMIPHHAQAIEMVALMEGRTTNERLLRLGGRIVISQRDEIALMSRWLRERGADVPGDGNAAMGHTGMDHGGMDHTLMPGMLTPDQMQQLADASGVEFERLFLTLMIGHHEGALIMVRELFSTPGGGQESWSYQFATDVDADQLMEIGRMQQMLDDLR